MQNRKQNWKRLRCECPCRQCGKDTHVTGQHMTRNGVKRSELLAEPTVKRSELLAEPTVKPKACA
jgi:hypothetical protein